MKKIVGMALAVAALAGAGVGLAQTAEEAAGKDSMQAARPVAKGATQDLSKVAVPDKIPPGYRAWTLISVAREEGATDDLRAILGNEAAVVALRSGKYPLPDGAIIARLAWSYDALAESAAAFGKPQSHVAGHPKNGLQFMVRDSTKYAATGGWGYVQFDDGKPSDAAKQQACFACHTVVKNRDYVFNRFAPDPPNGIAGN